MVERKKPPLDAAPYQAAMRRLLLMVPAFSLLGTLAAIFIYGWRIALGVAIGSLAGWLNFHLLHRVVNTLGPGGTRPARRTGFLLLGALLLLGGLGFAIVKLVGINAAALFAGLFMPLAAVVVSIFYEILLCKNMNPG